MSSESANNLQVPPSATLLFLWYFINTESSRCYFIIIVFALKLQPNPLWAASSPGRYGLNVQVNYSLKPSSPVFQLKLCAKLGVMAKILTHSDLSDKSLTDLRFCGTSNSCLRRFKKKLSTWTRFLIWWLSSKFWRASIFYINNKLIYSVLLFDQFLIVEFTLSYLRDHSCDHHQIFW